MLTTLKNLIRRLLPIILLVLFVGSVILIILKLTDPFVQVSPGNNFINVPIYSPIKVVFKSSMSESDAANVRISSFPQIEGTILWSDNNTVATFVPTKPLLNNNIYSVTAHAGWRSLTWRFRIVSPENVSIEDQTKVQTEADKNFGDWQNEVKDSYPWNDKLPLQTTTYFVYFDIDTKTFSAILYPKQSAATSVEAQVASLKQEVLQKLGALGVEPDKYPITWDIKPE